MPYYPQTNGGNKPHGKRAVVASKRFCEAFALFNEYYAKHAELVTMMNRCSEGRSKEALRENAVAQRAFVSENSAYLEMAALAEANNLKDMP